MEEEMKSPKKDSNKVVSRQKIVNKGQDNSEVYSILNHIVDALEEQNNLTIAENKRKEADRKKKRILKRKKLNLEEKEQQLEKKIEKFKGAIKELEDAKTLVKNLFIEVDTSMLKEAQIDLYSKMNNLEIFEDGWLKKTLKLDD